MRFDERNARPVSPWPMLILCGLFGGLFVAAFALLVVIPQ